MRLNAYLASAGISSRRKADELIKAGKVTVNGKPGMLDDQVSEADEVLVNGKPATSQKQRYILLNKPAGYVTTLSDPGARAKVVDLLKIKERVVPVGRLDRDTTGALLLTNDGDLAHKLMHPKFEVDKVYQATVEGDGSSEILNRLSIGIKVEGKMTAPAKAKKIAENKVELTIHEGRKHQVKKMLAAVGLPVKKLHRVEYAGLNLANLPPGRWRELTPAEVNRLKSAILSANGKTKNS